jgi:hypothetical protein
VRILVADPLAESGVAALAEHHDVDVKTGLSKDELLAIADGLRRDRRALADDHRRRRHRRRDPLKVIAGPGSGSTTSTSRRRPGTG